MAEQALIDPEVRIEGWKNIAAVLHRSVAWCKRTASRKVRPLPAWRVGKMACTTFADLNQWLAGEREATMPKGE